jgi:6-pyruvoyltetrahydropterin/6-carboxytetrahydropterin synthase
MKPVLEQLDHVYLNDVVGLENPTIENISRWIWEKLAPQLAGLYEIVLHETPRARCVYRGE